MIKKIIDHHVLLLLLLLLLLLSILLVSRPRWSRGNVGSNPANFDIFLQDVKILSTSPQGGTLGRGSRV